MRFTVRPRAKKGESLTSYLMYICEINKLGIKDLIQHIAIKANRQFLKVNEIYELDLFPENIININILSELLNLTQYEIELLTFNSIYSKFAKQYNYNAKQTKAVMTGEIIRDSRRFCSSCLKEGSRYKLLWQVKEINICEIHLTQLSNICPHCLSAQPYVGEFLSYSKCFKCKADLYEDKDSNDIESKVISNELNKYNDWSFLLNPKTKLQREINGYCELQSLAIKMLYLAQSPTTRDASYLSFWSKNYKSRILGIIKEKNNRSIALRQIINLVRYRGISMELFLQLEVPEAYLENINAETNNKKTVCLTEWCQYNGLNECIKEIKDRKYKNEIYSKVVVCCKCFIIFGFNKVTNNWEIADKRFHTLINYTKSALENGLALQNIIREFKTSYPVVHAAIGYLLNQRLLSEQLYFKYKPIIRTKNIKQYFKKLIKYNGSMRVNAYHLFGWDMKEYYYLYYSKEIQNFLMFEANKNCKKDDSDSEETIKKWRGKIIESIEYFENNNLEINIHSIAQSLGCSISILYRYKLNTIINKVKARQEINQELSRYNAAVLLVDNYIEEQPSEKLLNRKILYDELKLNIRIIIKFNSNIVDYIDSKINEHNAKIKVMQTQLLEKQIKKAMVKMTKQGRQINIRTIAKYLEIKEYKIRQNKDLKLYIQNY